MQLFKNAPRLSSAFVLVALAALALSGCTSSPTEPSGGNAPIPPQPPAPVVSLNVTVTADPAEITGSGASTITVDVRRSDNGQAPPDGTAVTLTTTLGGFNTAGGPQQVQVQLVNGRAQATLFAGTETGTATVRAQVTSSGVSGTGAANVRIGQAATFFVSSVQPNVGSAQGGEQVAILGGGFDGPVRVTFNGTPATVRSVSPTRIVVVTPSATSAGVPVGVGETASVNVEVTINLNEPDQKSDTLDRGFTYTAGGGGIQQPQVFSVTPASGTNEGGTRVTITGVGFQAPVQVLFGHGTSATSFNGVEATVESVTANQIVAITPAARGFGQNLTNQVVDILVKNLNSGFNTVSTQQFKYGTNVLVTALGPGSGPASGGTRVTIHGSGFDEPVAVSFIFSGGVGVAQQVISVTGTEIVILTSPAPLPETCPANGRVTATGVRVVNIETGDSDDADIGFNFILPLPQVTSVSPNSGGTGSTITIAGQNFGSVSTVTFGSGATGSSAQVVATSPNSLSVIVPNPPQGFTFNTQPCGTGGTQNVATPIDIVVTDASSRCSATFRGGFLLNPADTTCRNQTPPVANFSFFVIDATTHQMQFTDTSTGSPTSWQWDFTNDGVFDSSVQNPQFSYGAAGTYAVRLRVSNAAGTSETVKQVTVP